jgi:hypothetical protein
MNLYAYTIALPHATYHECVCAPDHASALSTVLATLPSDAVLLEIEQV